MAGAAVISLVWMAPLLDLTVSGTLSSAADRLAYAAAPSAFWTIRIVDLGFIVRVCLTTGVGLWRGSAAAIKASYGVASFMTLQAAAVLTMGWVMLWRQDPTATPTLVYVLTPLTLAGAAVTARLLISYARGALTSAGTGPAVSPRAAAPATRTPASASMGGTATPVRFHLALQANERDIGSGSSDESDTRALRSVYLRR